MNIANLDRMYAGLEIATLKFPQIRASQLLFLAAVAKSPSCTQTELCQKLGVTMSAVSRNVDVFGSGKSKSERHKSFGLIEAKRDLDDERLILLSLTDKGHNFLKLVLEASYGNLED